MATPSLSLCRVCLSNNSESKSIFSTILEVTTESVKYSDILKQLSPEIFLDPDDGLPQQICLECQYKIASTFQIQRTFKNSDRILRVKVCLAIEKPGCEQEDNNSVALEFIKLEVGEEELFDVQDDMEQKDPIEGLEHFRTENQVQGDERFDHRDMSSDGERNRKLEPLDDQTISQSNTDLMDRPETIPDTKAHSDRKSEGDNSLTCDICNKQLSNIYNLRRHKKTLHNINYSEEPTNKKLQKTTKKVEVACNICNDKSQLFNIHSLRRHKRLIHGDMSPDGQSNSISDSLEDSSNTELTDLPELIIIKNNSFTCEICNDQRLFFSNQSLKRHQKLFHSDMSPNGLSNQKPESFDDPITSQSNTKQMDHSKTISDTKDYGDCKSGGDNSFTCDICIDQRKFINIYSLIRHKKILHNVNCSDELRKRILTAKLQWAQKKRQKTRKNVKVVRKKSFACNICNEHSFPHKYSLERHIKVMHNSNDSSENTCLKETQVPYRNKITKRKIVDKRRHPCEICKISFAAEQSLIRHTKTLHANAGDYIQPRPKFSCDQCHRSFISKERLLIHAARHLTSIDDLSAEQAASCKIFECYSCDKFFFDSNIRFRHLQRHSPQISCKYCDERFEKMLLLRSHIKIHNKLINKPQSVEEYKRQKADEVKRGIIIKCGVTTYSCDTCKIGFSSPHRLYNHNREMHLDKHLSDARQFVCELCDSKFKTEYFYTHHQNTMHSEPITLEEAESNPLVACKICLKRFVSEKACKLHHEKHKPITSYTVLEFELPSGYQCFACSLIFTNPNTRRIHALTHGAGDFKCTKCSEKFTWVTDLHRHIRRKHKLYKKQYKCNICSKIVKNLTEFKRHMIRHQPKGEKLLSCHICEKKFRLARQVADHIKRVHENNPIPLCPECGKMVKESMNVHISREHRSEHLHQCPKCPRKFKTKSNLYLHIRSHDRLKSEKKFHCDECNAAFRYEPSVKTHKQRVHQKKARPYKCEQCEKSFYSKFNLAQHFRVHSKEKPFECEHCDRAFSQKGDLTKHLRLQHIGDNVYKCTICEAGFRFLRELKLHSEEHPPSADNLDVT